MLERQLQTWAQYPADVLRRLRFIVVDDGSPQPAEPVVRSYSLPVELYRIDVDIPWNMHGACNLGAHLAQGWILRTDLDHVLLPDRAAGLLDVDAQPDTWYRFDREWSDGIETGWRKPHVNSLLLHRDLYWLAGGYDEDYAGMYYGDGEFFRNLKMVGKLGHIPITLRTCKDVPDSMTPGLSRKKDAARIAALRARKRLDARATNPLRFPWHRVL